MERGAEGVDIALQHSFALKLLRWNIGLLSNQCSRGLTDEFIGCAKVDEHNVSIRCQQKIVRSYVSVYDRRRERVQ